MHGATIDYVSHVTPTWCATPSMGLSLHSYDFIFLKPIAFAGNAALHFSPMSRVNETGHQCYCYYYYAFLTFLICFSKILNRYFLANSMDLTTQHRMAQSADVRRTCNKSRGSLLIIATILIESTSWDSNNTSQETHQ